MYTLVYIYVHKYISQKHWCYLKLIYILQTCVLKKSNAMAAHNLTKRL